MTESSLLQGEERGGSDAVGIVTDERRRPCGKIGPPLRGRPEEPAGLRCLLARSYQLRVCAARLASDLLRAILTIDGSGYGP